jgi:hypothetical protein
MVNEIVVCGDSFGCGSGIPIDSCFEASFGGQVAEYFSVPHRVYARSGCCNYIIYLQIQKVIEDYKFKEKPFVLVTTTNHSRFTFPSDESLEGFNQYSIEDVDYYSYPPYNGTVPNKKPPFTPNKKPKLVSETISNVLYYLKGDAPNLHYLFTNVKEKMRIIGEYYQELYDDSIKQTYDNALILMMHRCLKEAGIDHLIMSPNEYDCRFIDPMSFFYNNWGEYSKKYPDLYGSGHCTEEGHAEVANKIIERIRRLDK